ncbi:tetratricopeptide repeat protein [uncultured Paludibaculum sp.]|uniref:tetratricopeptide repeat protein n=1 Tax=uncultured Paludibaculum sp. TaxID=1765020 RepID=UPI002AAAD170|nr:tetratricopeptide repeat protein [uncultured Paludibaculum sp.]
MRILLPLLMASCLAAELPADLRKARDAQDRPALDQLAAAADAAAQAKPNDPTAQYNAARAQLVRAEVSMELRDKNAAKTAAEAGIRVAEKAVALKPDSGEYHRILGTLCGQVIPANVLAGMRYGKCALDEVNKAVELAPKDAAGYLSRAVGNYYLPASFGGGPELALKDVDKALQLDPKDADAWLWKGIILRKLNRNTDARQALSKSLELHPPRIWTKQQLEKTPAK